MARERRSKSWWTRTVARWRRSGLMATEFAQREDLSVATLRWWSSAVGRDTRASHGSPPIEPIEIAAVARDTRGAAIEIAIDDGIVRFEVGVDAAYVAALCRALRGR